MAPQDYFVVTLPVAKYPGHWNWEIHRHSLPLGLRMNGEGYPSGSHAARAAGNKALTEFLEQLSAEEKRRRA